MSMRNNYLNTNAYIYKWIYLSINMEREIHKILLTFSPASLSAMRNARFSLLSSQI